MIDELKYEEVTPKIVKNWKNFKKREVWGRGETKIKVEKEEVMRKGDITKMKRWNEKKNTFKTLTLAS